MDEKIVCENENCKNTAKYKIISGRTANFDYICSEHYEQLTQEDYDGINDIIVLNDKKHICQRCKKEMPKETPISYMNKLIIICPKCTEELLLDYPYLPKIWEAE